MIKYNPIDFSLLSSSIIFQLTYFLLSAIYHLDSFLLLFLFVFSVIATLDYTLCAKNIDEVLTRTLLTLDGRADCVAVWVDFDLTPSVIKSENNENTDEISENNGSTEDDQGTENDNSKSNEEDIILRQWDEEKQDFPSHLKLNLKFFPLPVVVKSKITVLSTRTSFTVGDSDFKYSFKLE